MAEVAHKISTTIAHGTDRERIRIVKKCGRSNPFALATSAVAGTIFEAWIVRKNFAKNNSEDSGAPARADDIGLQLRGRRRRGRLSD